MDGRCGNGDSSACGTRGQVAEGGVTLEHAASGSRQARAIRRDMGKLLAKVVGVLFGARCALLRDQHGSVCRLRRTRDLIARLTLGLQARSGNLLLQRGDLVLRRPQQSGGDGGNSDDEQPG